MVYNRRLGVFSATHSLFRDLQRHPAAGAASSRPKQRVSRDDARGAFKVNGRLKTSHDLRPEGECGREGVWKQRRRETGAKSVRSFCASGKDSPDFVAI